MVGSTTVLLINCIPNAVFRSLRFFLTVLVLIASSFCFGQQDPLTTSEGVRSFWYNPATTATLNRYSANLTGRMYFFTPENPGLFQINATYKIMRLVNAPINFGVGLAFRDDRIGAQKEKNFALHLNLQYKVKGTLLVVGFAPGIKHIRFIFPTLPVDQTKFDLGIGINWFNEKFSIGFASSRVTQAYYEKLGYQSKRHYYINGRYDFRLKDGVKLRTTATYRTDTYISSAQALAYVVLPKNEISLGFGYRLGDAFLAGASIRFNKCYVGYFFDYVPNSFTTKFSHEFRLGFEVFDYKLSPVFSTPLQAPVPQ